MMSLICGIQKIVQVSIYEIQKQTHRHRGQTSGSQWGRGGARWGTGLRDTNYYI